MIFLQKFRWPFLFQYVYWGVTGRGCKAKVRLFCQMQKLREICFTNCNVGMMIHQFVRQREIHAQLFLIW